MSLEKNCKKERGKDMSNLKRRIEKAEAIVEAITMRTAERKAKLQELERLREKGDRLAAFELAAELEYGPNWTLARVVSDLYHRGALRRRNDKTR